MEFEIDFGTTFSEPAKPVARPLYASIDGMVAPLSAEEVAFQIRGSEAVHVMTLDVLKAMEVMQPFAPLEAHYAAIQKVLPGLAEKREALERVVGFMIDRGLVVEATSLLDASDATKREEEALAPLLMIRTCDRPEALEALLASLPASADFVLVIDDSRSAENVGKNRAIVEASTRGSIRIVDRTWRERLVARLVEEHPEAAPEAIRELLLPADPNTFTGGAAMNAGLLVAAGRRIVMLDDDMRLPLRLPDGASFDSIGLDPSGERPLSFLTGDGTALPAADEDWLQRALDACGGSLADVSEALGSPVDFQTLAGQSYRDSARLLDGAHVRTMQFGYFGDSCMETRLWLYLAPPASVRNWWQDRSTYFEQLQEPTIRHAYATPRVGEVASFTPAIVDATALVPPAAPSQRGEDMVFTSFLRHVDPQGLNLDLPLLLRHERPGARAPENPDAYAPWSSRFFAEFALAYSGECEAADPVVRMAHLAQRFEDLAAATPAHRLARLREFLGFMRARIIHGLQTTLVQSSDAPDYFTEDVRRWVEANGQALTEARPPRLRGWDDSLDAAGCADQLAEEASAYAVWLRLWPTLWTACRGRTDELLAL